MKNLKKRLYIFAGKPGTGKSTIIKHLFKKEKVIDIWQFYEPIRLSSHGVHENKTENAYKEMYKAVRNASDDTIIMEIGTKHPEISVLEIKKLQTEYNIKLFLCDASPEICYQRAVERGMRHSSEAWEKRMRQDFPNTFVALLEKTSIEYCIVNVEKSLETTIEMFKELI